jgi:hypothetical protein
MSAVRNQASGVEMTLFSKILMVVNLVMGVLMGSLQLTRSPPQVNLMRWGSAFWGRKLAQIRRYMALRS